MIGSSEIGRSVKTDDSAAQGTPASLTFEIGR